MSVARQAVSEWVRRTYGLTASVQYQFWSLMCEQGLSMADLAAALGMKKAKRAWKIFDQTQTTDMSLRLVAEIGNALNVDVTPEIKRAT